MLDDQRNEGNLLAARIFIMKTSASFLNKIKWLQSSNIVFLSLCQLLIFMKSLCSKEAVQNA